MACRAGAPHELVRAFGGLRRRRQVPLGRAGPGKTTFALLLLLVLLRTRTPGDPVPVRCSLSSCDPRRESTGAWPRRSVADAYPYLTDRER